MDSDFLRNRKNFINYSSFCFLLKLFSSKSIKSRWLNFLTIWLRFPKVIVRDEKGKDRQTGKHKRNSKICSLKFCLRTQSFGVSVFVTRLCFPCLVCTYHPRHQSSMKTNRFLINPSYIPSRALFSKLWRLSKKNSLESDFGIRMIDPATPWSFPGSRGFVWDKGRLNQKV